MSDLREQHLSLERRADQTRERLLATLDALEQRWRALTHPGRVAARHPYALALIGVAVALSVAAVAAKVPRARAGVRRAAGRVWVGSLTHLGLELFKRSLRRALPA